jgi:hypothetical protein
MFPRRSQTLTPPAGSVGDCAVPGVGGHVVVSSHSLVREVLAPHCPDNLSFRMPDALVVSRVR